MEFYQASPTVDSNIISGNYVTGTGGGVYCADSSSPTLISCLIVGNTGGQGIGMYYMGTNCNPTVINCTFTGNTSTSGGSIGGGMYGENATVINCTFSGNSAKHGGGMHDVNAKVTNCTFTGNIGDGIINYGIVTNCIFWNNFPEEIDGIATVSHSNIKGGYPGTGNIDSDPLFVDPANGDFHLTFNSPCRGSGDNNAATELYDFEGDPRICQGTVDIGADECYTHLYCMGDLTPGGSIEGKLIGLPGTSPVGLFFGSGELNPPLPTMWGDFHLLTPYVLVPLLPIPTDGVLVLPATIPVTPPAPYDVYMQALIGLNSDSLSNLCVLEVR